jgi:hypothetical protein
MSLTRAVVSVAAIFLGVSAAVAQEKAATCTESTRGSVSCPNYTAPAATAVPSASSDSHR